jgi:hypothetical protein
VTLIRSQARSPAAALRWIEEGRRFDVVVLDQGALDPDGAGSGRVVLADAIHATPGGVRRCRSCC